MECVFCWQLLLEKGHRVCSGSALNIQNLPTYISGVPAICQEWIGSTGVEYWGRVEWGREEATGYKKAEWGRDAAGKSGSNNDGVHQILTLWHQLSVPFYCWTVVQSQQRSRETHCRLGGLWRGRELNPLSLLKPPHSTLPQESDMTS